MKMRYIYKWKYFQQYNGIMEYNWSIYIHIYATEVNHINFKNISILFNVFHKTEIRTNRTKHTLYSHKKIGQVYKKVKKTED